MTLPRLRNYMLYSIVLWGLFLGGARATQVSSQDYFIAPERVEQHLQDYVVIDARSTTDYLLGHIPGALSASWQEFANMDHGPGNANWSTLSDHAKLQQTIRKLGITSASSVVVYGKPGGWGEEGRISWTLRRAGIPQVSILDGGYKQWRHRKYPTTLMPTTDTQKSQFVLGPLNVEMTIDTQTLRKHYRDYKILDARTPEEFAGAVLYHEARGGHLPGALNLPFERVLNPQGILKPTQEIRRLLAAMKIAPEDNIVTYCTAGIRSAYLAIALKSAGFLRVENYVPSFYHWAATPKLPLVKDPQ